MRRTKSPLPGWAAEIERRMLALGLNPTSLSRRADLGPTYVRDILAGRSKNPKMAELGQVASALKCTLDDIGYRPSEENLNIEQAPADAFAILERVNRLTQAVADLVESQAAQNRSIIRLLAQMNEHLALIDIRMASLDIRLAELGSDIRAMASEQILLGNRLTKGGTSPN